MMELWQLFWTFARIGALTFGGGYAMLPMIQQEVVERRQWATEEELLDYYALGQVTPGIIAINTATFVGHDRRGLIGGIAATLGMVFPSLVIIMTIATYFTRVIEFPVVQHAFAGVRVAVVALIVSAVLRLGRQSVKGPAGAILFVVALVAISATTVSPVIVVLAAAALGVVQALRAGGGLTKGKEGRR